MKIKFSFNNFLFLAVFLLNSFIYIAQAAASSDTTPPSIPAGLTATAALATQINLSWTASTDNVAVTGYIIYRDGLQVGTSNTTSYGDTGLTASTDYSYAVSSYDAAGNNSEESTSVSATTLSTGVQTINTTYMGLDDTFTSCSASMGIWGQAPDGPGPFPVHIHVVGTGEDYQSSEAKTIIGQMASRGFLAVSIQYPNSFQNPGTSVPYSCAFLKSKMACMFNAGSPSSALAAICALPGADCNLGITMSGISQGAQIVTMARNFDPRVQAVYGMADGDVLEVGSGTSIDMTACMDAANRSLPVNRLRAINGDADEFFGQTSSGVGTELNGITGQTCDPNNSSCLRRDGSGWYKVQDSEVKNPPAGHVYIADPGWQPPNTYSWSVVPNLDWLAGFIINTNAPVINSFIANPATVVSGASTTLTWAVNGATAVSINPGNIISNAASGSIVVSPAQNNFTYVLTATNSTGVSTATLSSSLAYGDISGDGQVTIYDAELAAQYSVGLITLTPAQEQAGMVSSATEIDPTIYDAYLIAQYAVGLITQFPVQQQ